MSKKLLILYVILTAPVFVAIIFIAATRNEGITTFIYCSTFPEKSVRYKVIDIGPWKEKLLEGFNRIEFQIGPAFGNHRDKIMKAVNKSIGKFQNNNSNNLFLFVSGRGVNIDMGICDGHNRNKCRFRQIQTGQRCINIYQIHEVVDDAIDLPDNLVPTTFIRENKY